MRYRELSIETSEAGVEMLTAALSARGIDDTEVDDPRDMEDILSHKESYEWDYVDARALEGAGRAPVMRLYFPDSEEGREKERAARGVVEEVRRACAQGFYGPGADPGTLRIRSSVRDDAEWKDKWKAYFKPIRVSDRLVVCPSWETWKEEGPERVISIDPGMAFGTGTHETTAMCLDLIDRYLAPGQRVLDLGCGSGILSIAAALLGAGDVLGIDVDREAVRVAKENVEKNHVQGVRVEYGDVTEGVDWQADLIVGNLMAELLCRLAPDVLPCLAPGGLFVSSGILTEKEDMVRQAYEQAGFRVTGAARRGEWCALTAVRSGDPA